MNKNFQKKGRAFGKKKNKSEKTRAYHIIPACRCLSQITLFYSIMEFEYYLHYLFTVNVFNIKFLLKRIIE